MIYKLLVVAIIATIFCAAASCNKSGDKPSQPDKAGLYSLIGMVQMFGSDVIFGAMTKSFNDGANVSPQARANQAKLVLKCAVEKVQALCS